MLGFRKASGGKSSYSKPCLTGRLLAGFSVQLSQSVRRRFATSGILNNQLLDLQLSHVTQAGNEQGSCLLQDILNHLTECYNSGQLIQKK